MFNCIVNTFDNSDPLNQCEESVKLRFQDC